jgi:hypothetical protein
VRSELRREGTPAPQIESSGDGLPPARSFFAEVARIVARPERWGRAHRRGQRSGGLRPVHRPRRHRRQPTADADKQRHPDLHTPTPDTYHDADGVADKQRKPDLDLGTSAISDRRRL